MGEPGGDPVVTAMTKLTAGGVSRGCLGRERGRRLCWIEAGTIGPPVVLVSGAGETGLDFATIVPALAERSRVIAYDRAGLGASDRASVLTLDSQVHDLVALLRTVGPAVLVGHSWGGLLAELAARSRPDIVAGLVLIDPFDEAFTADVPRRLRAASKVVVNGIVLLHLAGLFRRIATRMGRELAERCTQDPGIQASLVGAYVASYRTIRQVAMIGAENRLGDACTREIRAARTASAIPDVPVRILTATRGKPPALQQHVADLAGRTAADLPRAEHIVVPDSGHYIHHDQPATVIAAIDAVVTAVQ
jgi:pimeloyl-ACP methyl ester carboxylesterase